MTNLSYPKTPTRVARRSHLTPSKTPIITSSPRTPSCRITGSVTGSARMSGGRFHTSRPSPFSLTPSTTTTSASINIPGDRFIPSRRSMAMELSRRAINSANSNHDDSSHSISPRRQSRQLRETPLQKEFKRRMLSTMCNIPLERLNEEAEPNSVLSFGGESCLENKKPSLSDPFNLDFLRTIKLDGVNQDPATQQSVASKVVRKVASAPIRILDAPDIVDDYYLNLVSWSKDNILAVALARSVYLWNATTGDIHHLVTVEEGNNYITSVSWCTMPGHTHYIAVGTNTSTVHIYDGKCLRLVRSMFGHSNRVSALVWTQNRLTSGGRDSLILNHDVRVANNVVSTYKAHLQEVCGLKWNEDGTSLASGGNENYLCLWDVAMSGRSRQQNQSAVSASQEYGPRLVLKQHKAAVKALDWCPFHRGLLASGGGTADRSIKFWNTSSGAVLNSVDTGSQVCSIVWSRHQRELCSSHGYSENQLILWKYPTMTKIKELTGHTSRVLNMELSPDGTTVVSASADETLRFWNVFEENGGSKYRGGQSLLVGGNFGGPTIR